MSKVPVLVVDDDAEIRASLRMLLEDLPYRVVEAPHGELAVEYMQQSAERMVVLLDLMMPRMNGLDVLRVVRNNPQLQRHAIIMMTARHRTLPLEIVQIAGNYHLPLVTKPFEIDDLLAAVSSAVQRLG